MAQDQFPLKIGDIAPAFSLRTSAGRDFRLVDVLRSSAAIIVFIRGTW